MTSAYPRGDTLLPLLIALAAVPLWAWTLRRIFAGASLPSAPSGAVLASALFGGVVGFGHPGPAFVNTPQPYAGALVFALIGAALAHLLWRRVQAKGSGAAIALAFLIGSFPATGVALARTMLTIDDPTAVSENRADLRRWLAPWDGRAHLALAWHALRADEPDQAEARRRVAERAGVDRALAMELLAELRAQDGDCDAARDAFDEALRARAAGALERFDLNLEDAYRLPETFVRRCGLRGTAAPASSE